MKQIISINLYLCSYFALIYVGDAHFFLAQVFRITNSSKSSLSQLSIINIYVLHHKVVIWIFGFDCSSTISIFLYILCLIILVQIQHISYNLDLYVKPLGSIWVQGCESSLKSKMCHPCAGALLIFFVSFQF